MGIYCSSENLSKWRALPASERLQYLDEDLSSITTTGYKVSIHVEGSYDGCDAIDDCVVDAYLFTVSYTHNNDAVEIPSMSKQAIKEFVAKNNSGVDAFDAYVSFIELIGDGGSGSGSSDGSSSSESFITDARYWIVLVVFSCAVIAMAVISMLYRLREYSNGYDTRISNRTYHA